MAGSHRATRTTEPVASSRRPTRKKAPPRLTKKALAVAAVVALLPALALGTQRLLDSEDKRGRGQTAIPDVTSTRTPSVDPTSSTPPSSSPGPALPNVPASGPRRLTVRGLDVGFDDSIEPTGGGFQASSTAEAARWGSRGSPASPGTDTVFLVGKVFRNDASAFRGLGEVRTGDVITLRTQNQSVLKYTVQSATTRPAAGLLGRAEFTAKQPGRLVLVGVLYDAQDEDRTARYQVVVAQLSVAERG